MSERDPDTQEPNPLNGSLSDVSAVGEVSSDTYDCEHCGKQYKLKSNLNRHLHSHQTEQFRCSPCHRYFVSQEQLDKHVSIRHNIAMCEVCGKTFTRNSSLNLHRKSHEKQCPGKFICPFDHCQKKFYKQTIYQDHLNTHTGLQPYKCSNCENKFMSRYQRNFHERQCIGQTEIKCQQCASTFSHRSSLNNHMEAKHKQKVFTCGCGATFVYRSGLRRHQVLKNHTN